MVRFEVERALKTILHQGAQESQVVDLPRWPKSTQDTIRGKWSTIVRLGFSPQGESSASAQPT